MGKEGCRGERRAQAVGSQACQSASELNFTALPFRRNPNYRYRPVYRRETTTKRKRRKPTDDDEAEEEERKCEVVARVLLEGREVSEDQLQQEVEEQRIKDQEEGRHRSRSRSRSRSKSVNGGHGDMRHGRPSSAPPGQDPFQLDYMDQQMDDGFLRPGMLQSRSAATRSRAKTMPTQNDFDFSNTPFYGTSINPLMPATGPDYGFSMSGRLGSIGGLPVPSPRTAANMQSLFNAVNGDDSNGFAYPSGLKGNDENISLLSPSYSRKFSLGRWEIPQTASGPSIFASPAASHQPLNYSQYPDTATVNPGQPNYTYDANTGYNQPFTQGGDQAQPAPTYVYLSKADAENPEVGTLAQPEVRVCAEGFLFRSSITTSLKAMASLTMRKAYTTLQLSQSCTLCRLPAFGSEVALPQPICVPSVCQLEIDLSFHVLRCCHYTPILSLAKTARLLQSCLQPTSKHPPRMCRQHVSSFNMHQCALCAALWTIPRPSFL
jgi:hypothetical protein